VTVPGECNLSGAINPHAIEPTSYLSVLWCDEMKLVHEAMSRF
jgi:hypothetical protein